MAPHDCCLSLKHNSYGAFNVAFQSVSIGKKYKNYHLRSTEINTKYHRTITKSFRITQRPDKITAEQQAMNYWKKKSAKALARNTGV